MLAFSVLLSNSVLKTIGSDIYQVKSVATIIADCCCKDLRQLGKPSIWKYNHNSDKIYLVQLFINLKDYKHPKMFGFS